MRWQARCIRTDNRAGRQHRLYLTIKIAFDVHALHYGFDDPIDIGEVFQVVFDVAEGNESGGAFAVEGGGAGLERLLKSCARYCIAILHLAGRYNIEQQAGNADVSEVRGDRGPHDARAKHCYFANLVRHGYDILSISVATP